MLKYLFKVIFFCIFSNLCFASENKDEKHGYWWYEDSKNVNEDKEPAHRKPEISDRKKMMEMHPDDLKVLLNKHLKYAIYTLNPEDIVDYYKIQDIVRRKSAAFTAISSYVMLHHPELNAKAEYPTTNAGRNIYKQENEKILNDKLSVAKNNYAFGYFSKNNCQYCETMLGTLKYFIEKHNWRIKEYDINKVPQIGARFNVSTVPMLIIIEKGTNRWMPVSVGVESLTSIEQNTYRAIRLLEGSIKPEQYFVDGRSEGGFFDPKG